VTKEEFVARCLALEVIYDHAKAIWLRANALDAFVNCEVKDTKAAEEDIIVSVMKGDVNATTALRILSGAIYKMVSLAVTLTEREFLEEEEVKKLGLDVDPHPNGDAVRMVPWKHTPHEGGKKKNSG